MGGVGGQNQVEKVIDFYDHQELGPGLHGSRAMTEKIRPSCFHPFRC